MEINKKADYLCDLHCHTTRSDGADTPKEFIDNAACRGMKIIAITDHDIAPPETVEVEGREMDIVRYAENKNLILLRGIEISCETDIEDVHLLCFGCDWQDPFFGILEQEVAKSRRESYKRLVELLNADGIWISWEEVLDNNHSPIREDRVQKKMIFELMARKGFADDWAAAKLQVREKPAYQVKREKPDPAAVIKEVHRCGGIVILAHPYLICDNPVLEGRQVTRYQYIEHLIESGLDGIEACYTYDKTSYQGEKSKSEIFRDIKEKYKDRVSILSGGSDYHADHKKGVRDARYIGECGITEEYFYSNEKLRKLI